MEGETTFVAECEEALELDGGLHVELVLASCGRDRALQSLDARTWR